jgi:mRNA interferase RelE/StbE
MIPAMGKSFARRGARGPWRYRVGDDRRICDIQDEKITVLVLEVGHRKEVHR